MVTREELQKLLNFRQYLLNKIKREPYPLKNMVNDVFVRFDKEFKEELTTIHELEEISKN